MQVTTLPTFKPMIPAATPKPVEHQLPEPNVTVQPATILSSAIASSCPSTTAGVIYLNDHFNGRGTC